MSHLYQRERVERVLRPLSSVTLHRILLKSFASDPLAVRASPSRFCDGKSFAVFYAAEEFSTAFIEVVVRDRFVHEDDRFVGFDEVEVRASIEFKLQVPPLNLVDLSGSGALDLQVLRDCAHAFPHSGQRLRKSDAIHNPFLLSHSPRQFLEVPTVGVQTARHPASFGYTYLEKFIQITFRVPRPSSSGIDEFLKSLGNDPADMMRDNQRRQTEQAVRQAGASWWRCDQGPTRMRYMRSSLSWRPRWGGIHTEFSSLLMTAILHCLRSGIAGRGHRGGYRRLQCVDYVRATG